MDELKNKYSFNNAIINFQDNELIADGIKIDFLKIVLIIMKMTQD